MQPNEWTDRIFIQGLEFYGFHGASDEEQTIGHRYSLDVRLCADTRAAALSDALTDTVDYSAVTQTLLRLGTHSQFRLLEALAQQMAEAIFNEFPQPTLITIRLQKLQPPMNAIVEAVGVEITRLRPKKSTIKQNKKNSR